jgi:hypothetical protein
MTHAWLKAGAALAAGSIAFAGQALAVAPLPMHTAPFIILAEDQENEEVWQDLRPDITPPPAAIGKEGEAPEGMMREPPKEGGSGDEENKELWRDLETGVTPPPGE